MAKPNTHTLVKFRVFCIYLFVERLDVTSKEVYAWFEKYGINASIDEDYEVLHSMSSDNIFDSLLKELSQKGWKR